MIRKVLIIGILSLSLSQISQVGFASLNNNNFSDLEKHWSKTNVEKLVLKGIISGYEDGTFKPDNEISVAEFIKLLMVNNKIPLGAKGDSWYDQYINGARDIGLIQGEEYKDFTKPIYRIQMVRLIDRALNLGTGIPQRYEDSNLLNGLGSAVNRVSTVGIMGGFEDHTFRPYNYATRAEASTVIKRIDDYLNGKTIVPNVELIPDYNKDGSWTDEWFLENVKHLRSYTNYSDNANGCYKIEDNILYAPSHDDNDNFIYVSIDDKATNERMIKLLKYFTQVAYETNRFARVRLVEGISHSIRIDLSSNYRYFETGDIDVGFPLNPNGYMEEAYEGNLDEWNIQRVDVSWYLGKLFDDNSIPKYIADKPIERYNYIVENDYILEPYAEFLVDSFKLIYGEDYKEILDYVLEERLKELKNRTYKNISQVTINGIKIHSANDTMGSQTFLSEVK